MGLKAGHCMTGEPAASVDSHIVPARADQEEPVQQKSSPVPPVPLVSQAKTSALLSWLSVSAKLKSMLVAAKALSATPPGGAVTLMVSGGALSIVTVIEETGIDQPMSPVRARAVIE